MLWKQKGSNKFHVSHFHLLFQKVFYLGHYDGKTYESTVRSCSAGPCVERNDFENCTRDIKENPGCMQRSCCNQANNCNGASHERAEYLTSLVIFAILFVVFELGKWDVCVGREQTFQKYKYIWDGRFWSVQNVSYCPVHRFSETNTQQWFILLRKLTEVYLHLGQLRSKISHWFM